MILRKSYGQAYLNMGGGRNSDEVAAWLADDSQELTRGSVKLLREFLDFLVSAFAETGVA